MGEIVQFDPREWIKRTVRRALTPKDHDPQEWALAVIAKCEERGHVLTQDEVEMICEQSTAPIPVEAMADEICHPQSLRDEIAENMGIQAGGKEEEFYSQAAALLKAFEAAEGRLPHDIAEIEAWSLSRQAR